MSPDSTDVVLDWIATQLERMGERADAVVDTSSPHAAELARALARDAAALLTVARIAMEAKIAEEAGDA
jgi:hypothetical protein